MRVPALAGGTVSAVEPSMAPRITNPGVVLTIALAITPTGDVRAQRGYAPGTSHYKVTVVGEGARDQLGARQSVNYETSQSFTLTLGPGSGDTLAMSITIDSLTGRLSNGVRVPAGAGAGITVDAAISKAGVVYRSAVRAGTARTTFDVDADELARFLPLLRGDLRVGAQWSDTLTKPVSQLGMSLARQIVTDYQVLGDTIVDGAHAWRVSRSSRSSVDGEGSSMGQKVTLKAVSTGVGLVVISDAGTYLGGNSRDDVHSTATIGQPGVAVTETQTLKTRVERLP